MDLEDVKVKVTADTADVEAKLASLKATAEGIMAPLLKTRTLVIACVVLALFLIGIGTILGVLSARQSRALAAAQAVSAAQQQLVEQAEQRLKDRDVAWQTERAAWQKEREAIRTAPQAVRVIEKYLPATVGQTVPDVTPAQIAAEVVAALPPSPTYVVTTPQAEVATAQAVQEGKECAAHVLKLEADGVDLRTQVQAVTTDRDTWRTAAQGGSLARRILRVGIVGACGAGGAAVGAGRGSQGAAIGSFIGAVACTIATK
jgi:hypothetical protein